MPIEIERKFLVRGDSWKTGDPTYFCQGYLCHDPLRTVRVRIAGEKAWLTVKSLTVGAARPEFEYSIPIADAQQLMDLCDRPLIEKKRWLVPHQGHTWEIDEFLGENTGLIVAEIELESEQQNFDLPSWAGREVTDDARYYNSNLSINPYRAW